MFAKSTNSLLSALLFCVFFINGCAVKPPQPVPVDAAIDGLTGEIISSLASDGYAKKTKANGELLVVYNPFYSAGSSGVLFTMSDDIVSSLKRIALENDINLRLEMMRTSNLHQADYLIQGQFIRESFALTETVQSQPYWHIIAELISLSNYRKIAQPEAWVSGEINSDESPLDKDNPITIPRKPLPVEQVFLEIQSKINEAREFYDNNNYEDALSLYQDIVSMEQGQLFETYVGLYLTNFMLNQPREAAAAFVRLLEISIEENNALSCKFLFTVNKADFITDKSLRKQYDMWIREIGKYFSASSYCLNIIGHSSRSGPESYNLKLSKMRAEKIQQLLSKYFPETYQRSVASGRGYAENIVGSGTDDEQDAVDRRVEFKIVECN